MTTTNNQRKVRLIIFSLALTLIVGYSAFQAKNLLTGPTLSIESPINGETINQEMFRVKGEAHNISHITLNDSQIFVDEKGVFEEKIIASSGYSVLKLSVTDRFGRTKTRFIEISRPEESDQVYASVRLQDNVDKNNL